MMKYASFQTSNSTFPGTPGQKTFAALKKFPCHFPEKKSYKIIAFLSLLPVIKKYNHISVNVLM